MSRPRPQHLPALLVAFACLAGPGACLKVPEDESHEPAANGEAPATAEAALARYVAAIGGEEALRKLEHRTMEARMVIKPAEGCEEDDPQCPTEEQQGSFLLQKAKGPKLYRRTVVGNFVEERGFDGARSWQHVAGQLGLDDPELTAISREDAVLHWYFDLPARGVKLTLEPSREQDSEGAAVVLDGVRWQVESMPKATKTMWFARETGLLHEERMEVSDEDGQTASQVMLYSDYRDVDGVKVPFQIRMINKLGDYSQEIVFQTQRIDHKQIADATFAVPDVPPPEPLDDPGMAALVAAREAAKAAPRDRDAQLELARVAWLNAFFDEAGAAAERTLKLDGKEVEALWILARLRVMEGRGRDAQKLLDRAGQNGIEPGLVAAQEVWLHSHALEFREVADALERASPNNAPLAGRFRNLTGDPLATRFPKGVCQTEIALQGKTPLAVFDIELDGQTVPAVLDTAATDIIIDAALAKAAKVVIRSRTPINQDGDEMGHGQVKELTIGDAVISDVPVDVLPDGAMDTLPGENPPRAVLGVRALERLLVAIDMPARVLTIGDPDKRCKNKTRELREGASVPFWIHETHFLYVRAELNDAPGLYWINTGMRGVAVAANSRAYAYAGIPAPLSPSPQGVALVDVASIGIPGAFTLADQKGAHGYFAQESTSDHFRVDGMIGLGLLGARKWTIDFPGRRFYFADAAQPAPKDRGE